MERSSASLSTPYVLVNLGKVQKNIQGMVERLARAGIEHRPHIKTHKSAEIAKKQLELGAIGITVAKLSEAEAMVRAGITDLLVAYPIVGSSNLRRLANLTKVAKITTSVDSLEGARAISKVGERLGKKIKVLLELDGGKHRGGVQLGSPALELAGKVRDLPGIQIVGIFTYVSKIYAQISLEDAAKVAREEAEILLRTKEMLNRNGFDIKVVSGGSTASSFFPEALKGITESRAGNYVFLDPNTMNLGLVDEEDCALSVRSTVVSVPLLGHATIDAGSKTLTSDLPALGDTHGHVRGKPGVQIPSLDEEHGYLRFDAKRYEFRVGDQIDIIPAHACVITNLNRQVYAARDGLPERPLAIDARGTNY